MNSTELASMLFPFDPESDRVIFYGTTIAYSLTALYNIMLITCRVVRRCIPTRRSVEVPFAKLSSVCVEQPKDPTPKGHEITTEYKF